MKDSKWNRVGDFLLGEENLAIDSRHTEFVVMD